MKESECHSHMNVINNAYVSDKYQYTMGKSYLECGKQGQIAVFNLFYRKWGAATERLGRMIGFGRVGAIARRAAYFVR